MRVTIDGRMLGESGIGRYIQNIIAGLAAIDKETDYTVLSMAGDDKRLVEEVRQDNVKYQRLKSPIPIYSLKEQIRLPGIIKKTSPEVVHYPSFNLPVFMRQDCPAVVTIHDLIYYLFPDACPGRFGHLYARFMFRRVVKTATRIITVSDYTKGDIIRHMGVRPEDITVIYHGIDAVYSPVKDKARLEGVRDRHGIKGDYIFYAGTHQPRKNLVRLVKAFAGIKNKDCRTLVLSGKIEKRYCAVYDEVRRLGIEDRVRFIGVVSEQDLPALYSMARVFVFPSLYEGFGFPVLEAMACGSPVITSGVSSLPEVAGGAAVIIDPEDVGAITEAMDRVLASKDLSADLREKGLKRSRSFTWKEAAEKTLGVYRSARGFGRRN